MMIVSCWPLLVSCGAVGLSCVLGVVWGRRGAATAKADAQRWEEIAEAGRVHIRSLEESLRLVVVSQDERNLNSDEQLLAESKKHIEELKAQLLQNQEGLIEILRAQLTEQEARAESVEKLAHEWAEVAAERRTRIGELEAKLLVEQGTISQLRAQRLELEKANVALRKGAE
jgi:TolA-binding protein